MLNYEPIPFSKSLKEALDERVDDCIEYFSHLSGIGSRIDKIRENRPRVEWFSPLVYGVPSGAYVRRTNTIILDLRIYNKITIGEEVGHWIYYELNEDPTLTGDFDKEIETKEDHIVKQLHELVGRYFSLIYTKGEREADMNFVRDKDIRIGYQGAIRLYEKFGYGIIGRLVEMGFEEGYRFVRDEAPLSIIEKASSMLRKDKSRNNS